MNGIATIVISTLLTILVFRSLGWLGDKRRKPEKTEEEKKKAGEKSLPFWKKYPLVRDVGVPIVVTVICYCVIVFCFWAIRPKWFDAWMDTGTLFWWTMAVLAAIMWVWKRGGGARWIFTPILLYALCTAYWDQREKLFEISPQVAAVSVSPQASAPGTNSLPQAVQSSRKTFTVTALPGQWTPPPEIPAISVAPGHRLNWKIIGVPGTKIFLSDGNLTFEDVAGRQTILPEHTTSLRFASGEGNPVSIQITITPL